MSELWRDESLSNLVSEILSRLGYSLPMVNLRRKIICYRLLRDCSKKHLIIVTGSKAEGITKFFEGDVDYLFSFRDIISTTTGDESKQLLLDRKSCPPGYTRLSFLRDDFFEDVLPYIQNSLIMYNEKQYLGSTAWKSVIKIRYSSIRNRSETYHFENTRGPSLPMTLSGDFAGSQRYAIKCDTVLGIICDCPDILQPWIDRPRKLWPPYEAIRDISQMEAYVVPVGHVTSDMQDIEWRICFTRAEHRLIDSFNDCQIKLLVLMKMISKSYLMPLCKEMTSYIMKNVVYWTLEKLQDTYFEGNNLLKAVEFALISLRTFIRISYLPNYMIPERNLLADKVSVSERYQLCLKIESLLRHGPRILLGCDKIDTAMYAWYSCPRAFFEVTQFQCLTELIVLKTMVINPTDLEQIVTRRGISQMIDSDYFLSFFSSLVWNVL